MSAMGITVDGIVLPSQAALDQSADAFAEDWGELDKVLYTVCREHPGHDERRHVTAKVALVGRAYQAGLERCITPGPGQQGVMIAADFVWRHGGEVDEIIAAVRTVSEPLTPDDMVVLVQQHGRFTSLLTQIPECSRRPRSFASKYLHFHHRVVPIYDSYAYEALLGRVKWTKAKAPFQPPAGADADYADYCARFYKLYELCWQHSLAVTVKSLDTYLWAVPG